MSTLFIESRGAFPVHLLSRLFRYPARFLYSMIILLISIVLLTHLNVLTTHALKAPRISKAPQNLLDLSKQRLASSELPIRGGNFATSETPIVLVNDEVSTTDDPDWQLDHYQIQWGHLENYELRRRLGEGEYAEVYDAIDTRYNRRCVTKVLKQPISQRSITREIKILQDLSGGPNILQFVDAAMDDAQNTTAIVTEYVNNTYYRTLYPKLSDYEVRFYMFQLLQALDYAHGKNIMHRDIKPHNFMIEYESQKLRLIDWGLGDYYNSDFAYTTVVGSRFWLAPEILVGYEWYNLSADMWSFGCVLAAIVFGSEPFFYGRHNNVNQMIKIAEVLGTQDLFDWLDKYGIELSDEYNDISSWYDGKPWSHFVNKHNENRVGVDAIDLISKILVYDHEGRLSASEALLHPYFDMVRQEATNHINSTTLWI